LESKRFLSSLVAMTCLLSLIISGCSNSKSQATSDKTSKNTNGSPVELVFWNPFGGGDGDYEDQIVKAFNDSQKDVVVKQLRLASGDYYAKLGTALASGKGPDIAVVHVDKLAPFVKAKQVLAIDDIAAKVGFSYDEITDSNAQSVMYDGKHYAVPLDTHFHVMYYNEDILKKADLLTADGKPNLTDVSQDGFVKFLQQIKTKVPDVTPMSVNTPYFQEPFYNLYYEAGGDLLNSDLTKAAINNQKALDVLKYYLKLYDTKLSDVNDKTPWQTFSDGKSAIWFGGVWEAGGHFSDKAHKIGAIPLPPIFGSNTHWASSHTLAVPAYDDPSKQQAALKFAKYYTEIAGKIWGQAGHVPAGKAVAASAEYNALPYRSEFIAAQKTVKFAPRTDKYNSIDTAIQEVLQNIVFKKVTPQEGLKTMEKNINDILDN
jgi:multiple sugar transport system substrate-binding protein